MALGLGTGLFVLLLHGGGFLRGLEWKSWDWRLRTLSDPGRASPEIIILLVDQHSLDFFEQDGLPWPWPRQLYAAAVEFCRAGGARAIVFDVLFSESSFWGLEDDLAFGLAIARAGNVHLAAFLSATQAPMPDTAAYELLQRHAIEIPGFPGEKVLPRASVTLSVDEILAPARSMGNVSFAPDADGIFRRLPLVCSYQGRLYPALPLAVAIKLLDGPLRATESGVLSLAGRGIPLDDEGRLLIRFHGGAGTYRSISMASVIQSQMQLEEGLDPQIDPAFLEDRVVLVGFSAPGLLDLRPTPFSSVYPGVEVHATVIDNLLQGDFFALAPDLIAAIQIILLAMATGLAVTWPRQIWRLALYSFICLMIPLAAALIAFHFGIWLPLVAPFAAVLICFGSGSLLNYALEGRQKRFLKKVFRHYLSPSVIEEMLKNPEQLRLGGQRRQMSIFFSDLVGFTSLGERLTPEELTELLNLYLSEMTGVIFAHGGTVDKYIGDAIVAFWNAPLEQPDHATRACLAALDCHTRLAELRDQRLQAQGQELFMRIGVNTGPMVVGNMGSRERFDYSVLGDAVNLGARLESACKQYGVLILIGEETYQEAQQFVEAREVDLIRVVGKKKPVRIYELLARRGSLAQNEQESIGRFQRGLELYRRRSWSEAVEIFQELSSDPVAQVYLQRCRQFQTSPPDPDWDGVWELTKK